ncbi:MAG: PD-(D/E)XK nuclease family protein [Bacteroidetes bacterium]|nr:PD-(D/E)XK nuclease family protein [Bacteroidota bacterium]
MIKIQKNHTKYNKRHKTKRTWLTPSNINTFIHCPRNFYYIYKQGRKGKPTIHMIRGIAVHTALEEFYSFGLHRMGNRPFSELKYLTLSLFQDAWNEQYQNIKSINLTQDELDFFYNDSLRMIINFLHDFLESNGFHTPKPITEKKLFSLKLRLFGKVDVLTHNKDGPLLLDYKTSKSKLITPDHKRQLGLYALLYKLHYNKTPNTAVQFLNFRNGTLDLPITKKYLNTLHDLVFEVGNK